MCRIFCRIKYPAAAYADNDFYILNTNFFGNLNSFIKAGTVHCNNFCVAEILAYIRHFLLIEVY